MLLRKKRLPLTSKQVKGITQTPHTHSTQMWTEMYSKYYICSRTETVLWMQSPEQMLTQFYVATRPQRVKLENK